MSSIKIGGRLIQISIALFKEELNFQNFIPFSCFQLFVSELTHLADMIHTTRRILVIYRKIAPYVRYWTAI